MAKKTTTQTKDIVQDIINKSGNKFHFEVVDFLIKHGREVEVSPYYSDFATNISREIDIIARKYFEVNPGQGGGFKPFKIGARLFIECKYINEGDKIVGWFNDKDMNKVDGILSENRIVSRLFGDEYNSSVSQYIPTHHYRTNEPVAKLFTNSQKQDIMFGGINQVLHGLIYFKDKYNRIYDPSYSFDYPVILVNNFDGFYSTKLGNDSYSKIDNNFLFDVNYSYIQHGNHINNRFLVDIVSANLLEDFVNNIGAEMDLLVKKRYTHSEREARKNS